MSVVFATLFGWIFSMIAIIVWDQSKDFLKKKYVYVWVEKFDKNGNRKLSEEPKPIGEYKGYVKDSVRNAYRLEFRHYTRRYYVYCPYTFDRLISQCKYIKYMLVRYVLDALMTSVKLEKSVKTEHDYSRGWKLYFAFKFVFNDRLGLVISPLVMILLCGIINPASVEFSLYGALLGEIISVANGLSYRFKLIKPKKKIEFTTHERYLYPVESLVQYVDLYEVEYDLEVPQKKNDGTTEINIVHYGGDEKDPLIIEGFEKVQDLRINTRIKEFKPKFIKTITKERNVLEMKNNRRSYLARNAFMWNKIMTLQTLLAGSTQKIRDLHEQLSYEQATKHQEISESMETAYLQAESKMMTLKRLMERKFGSAVVSKDFKGTMEDISKELNSIEIEKLLKKFNQVIDIAGDVALKLGVNAIEKGIEVDLDEIGRIMKENGGSIKNVAKIEKEKGMA